MTRKQLEAVHDALTQLIDSWNDAAADEDRGRSNDGLVLTVFDDGSGTIGRRKWATEGESVLLIFDDFEELSKSLAENEYIEFERE